MFGKSSFYTKRKATYMIKEDFFNQEENFDVLFFGSSHMLNTVFPMQLWNDYGIVSYNLANPTERIATSYYNMLLALEQTNPKLVVIDGFMCLGQKIKAEQRQQLHTVLDAYPLSYTKYLAIRDLFDGQNMLDNMAEYLFDFSIYHSRWDELNKNDFEILEKYEKGAQSLVNVAIPKPTSDFNSISMYNKKETVNMKYLRKIIEHCKQNDIEVMVTYIPFPTNDAQISHSKYLKVICDEYNVNYINFLNMNIVNYNIDCYDKGNHLNASGARKVTDYIGKYIIEHYNIQDQRQNEDYSFWNQDYDEYINFKISVLNENKDNLNNYLMLLYGEKDIKYNIKIASSKVIEENSTLYNLLVNIENNYQIDDAVFEKDKTKTIQITIYDNRNNRCIDTVQW